MFPYDAITIYGEQNTSASTFNALLINSNLFDNENRTILYARIWTDTSHATDKMILGCGTSASDANTTEILSINGRQLSSTTPRVSETWGNILCDQSVYVFNTANTTSEYQYQITYLPYDINTSTTSPSYIAASQNLTFIFLVALTLLWYFVISVVYNKIFKKIT